MGQKNLAILTVWLYQGGFFSKKCTAVFARWPKKVVVITRWPYYRGGRKAGFCCTSKQRFRHVQTLVRLTIIFLKQVAKKAVPVFVFSTMRQLGIFCIECPLYSAPRTNLLSSTARMFADRWSSMSKGQLYQFFLFGSQLLSLSRAK